MGESNVKLKVGIFFGGPSREREIAFAGGRTVFDNLDKALFEPIPIFVDSFRNFTILDWEYLYKGTIRDFFPPVEELLPSPNGFQIYEESLNLADKGDQVHLLNKVGQAINPEDLPQLINIAFLALHGEFGEDGELQQILQDLDIPYTGSGVRASQIGINKAIQKELMVKHQFSTPEIKSITRDEWEEGHLEELFDLAKKEIGYPMVIRPARQGSSIGVSIIPEASGLSGFQEAVNKAFFIQLLDLDAWATFDQETKVEWLRSLTDIREGIGFPLDIMIRQEEPETIFHPEHLLEWLDRESQDGLTETVRLVGHQSEEDVILESFINGVEFSCIVLRKPDGGVVALPPTEIIKNTELFDYRSKYLPGMSRKVTPIDLPDTAIEAIRKETERLFTDLGFQVYARIDGFYGEDGAIFLNDPNTTSGMLPSSFFFHQAAEIGLSPSEFLTYIIRASLQERIGEQPENRTWVNLLQVLDDQLNNPTQHIDKKTIGVILGGYSFERHISVESGRNIYEKLSSSTKYQPVPIFLSGDVSEFKLYQIPLNLLLKDNADDIRDKIAAFKKHPIVEKIKEECADIISTFADPNVIFEPAEIEIEKLKEVVDGVFIALHGRPGEDGELQTQLSALQIPFNGSDELSSAITINKYETLRRLGKAGFPVTKQVLMPADIYQTNPNQFYAQIEKQLAYPFIAKPVDDGCSSAVIKIDDRKALEAYAAMMFRSASADNPAARETLGVGLKEEFPIKSEILFEQLIESNGAAHFLEITGGLLTRYGANGLLEYEIFEPSETLATGGILSLEEKFLAGEGQNITPARFATATISYEVVAEQVKKDLKAVAELLNIQGYARIDAFVRVFSKTKIETIVVEVNSLPGMTPATCIFHQAAINHYKPYQFIDSILEFAFERQDKKVTAVASPTKQNTMEEQEQPSEGSVTTTGVESAHGKVDQGSVEKSKKWQPIVDFLKSGEFLLSLGILVLVCIGLGIAVSQGLKSLTKHGDIVTVPDLMKVSKFEAQAEAKRMGFEIGILDSIFVLGSTPNYVLDQEPKPGSEVKEGRKIYLVITKTLPPEVQLPSLIGSYQYNQYKRKLQLRGVKLMVGSREFRSNMEEGSIIYLEYNGNIIRDRDLRKGVKVPEGAVLKARISERYTGRVQIPDLECLTFNEALFMLESNGLVAGESFAEGANIADYSDMYVTQQKPRYQLGREVRSGSVVDLYLSLEKPESCNN